ncbi:MAG: thioredoxin [Bacteroidales bacterium]|nr:thioredoxin [Bacteroidales bacterium]
MALQITDANAEEILAGNQLVVVDFWGTHCGPCMTLAPIIDELAAEYEGKAVIGKYNVEEEEGDFSIQYRIRAVPTLVFIKNGVQVHKITGAAPKADIKAAIEANL